MSKFPESEGPYKYYRGAMNNGHRLADKLKENISDPDIPHLAELCLENADKYLESFDINDIKKMLEEKDKNYVYEEDEPRPTEEEIERFKNLRIGYELDNQQAVKAFREMAYKVLECKGVYTPELEKELYRLDDQAGYYIKASFWKWLEQLSMLHSPTLDSDWEWQQRKKRMEELRRNS